MTDGTILERRPQPAAAADRDTRRTGVWDLAALLPILRMPKQGEDMPDDIRRLLEEDELFDEEVEEAEPGRVTTPPAGMVAGMTFCIPALSLIGLLYTLLK